MDIILECLNKIKRKYCIQEVGIPFSDMIIGREDFISAVTEINALGNFITEVTWWKFNKISDPDPISMGGPICTTNKEYFYGETNFCKTFESVSLSDNKEQVLSYYSDFIKTDMHDLLPAITLDIADDFRWEWEKKSK